MEESKIEKDSVSQFKGTLAVYQNGKPTFSDVIWRWFIVFFAMYWLSFYPSSVIGRMMLFYIRFFAIITTFIWLIVPKFTYQFEPDKPVENHQNKNEKSIKVKKESENISEKQQYCVSCGNSIREDAEFCGNCGIHL